MSTCFLNTEQYNSKTENVQNVILLAPSPRTDNSLIVSGSNKNLTLFLLQRLFSGKVHLLETPIFSMLFARAS